MGSSTLFKTILATIFVCLIVQVGGNLRRRRQYTYNNYGAYGLQPAVAAYYGTSGGGSYTGNNRLQNVLIAGGVVYQYPTPVNVISGGSYDQRQYNSYPGGADGTYYPNLNNMRLPTRDGWYPQGYFQSYPYPFLPIYNAAQCHTGSSLTIKLFFIFIACIISARIL